MSPADTVSDDVQTPLIHFDASGASRDSRIVRRTPAIAARGRPERAEPHRTLAGSVRRPRPPFATVVTDLDRTLMGPGGRATAGARRALREIRAMGFRALLVSGRTYADLHRYAPQFGTWDGLVAEDGAVVEAPMGRTPFVRGRTTAAVVHRRVAANPRLHPELGEIVASVPLRERRLLARTLAGLPVALIANVDRLMVLPAGVTKRSGVRTALRRLGVAGHGYAAIGDAENDLDLLAYADLSAAVANAIPAVRAVVDYRCRSSFDRGVLEFVEGPVRDRTRPADPRPG
jgi:hydroxymethylpyrimidine pyrophosphatase-like HAD family hydrolase